MDKIECSVISPLEVFTFGLPYTVSNNRGELIISEDKILFKKDSKVEWEIKLKDLKSVKGIFYLHLTTKDREKIIIRTKRSNLKKIKNLLLEKLNKQKKPA
ncbi:hypothetical protein [Thermotomaculum hydrothermale]|uniref:hypothetical protein n=1 Tax=Thermotomaculum hydrothermale TaxID=981385 RepID=UPI001916B92A|nr:hypothetical protein [Thermotomaculum hydrothermale]